jgi:hypothetical protein
MADMYTSRWTIISQAWSNPVSRADRWAVRILLFLIFITFFACTTVLVIAIT